MAVPHPDHPATPAATGRLRLAELGRRGETGFRLEPDAPARAALAAELGLVGLPKLRFVGRLEPRGARDWELVALLGATVVQPCVVTLAPVKSRIDEKVGRIYCADHAEPEGDEVEMPADDSIEPLPEVLDLVAVMVEALVLALPLYPRVAGAELGEAVFTAPGAAPLTDGAMHPFSELERLRRRKPEPRPPGGGPPAGESPGEDEGD